MTTVLHKRRGNYSAAATANAGIDVRQSGPVNTSLPISNPREHMKKLDRLDYPGALKTRRELVKAVRARALERGILWATAMFKATGVERIEDMDTDTLRALMA